MKFRTFCLLLAFAGCCFIFGKARAGTLEDAVKDKTYVDSGTCHLNAKGDMAKTEDESVGKMLCQRSVKMGDSENVYFLLFQSGKPVKYIKVNVTTKATEVIWIDPASMV